MQSHNKGILIGNFVQKNKILAYMEYLNSRFKIKFHKMFVYTINGNQDEYLVTFKANSKEPYIRDIYGATIMHVKNGCLFSINALNRLINKLNGSVDKEYKLDWSLYQDKLIIITNNELVIEPILKIEDKCQFFK